MVATIEAELLLKPVGGGVGGVGDGTPKESPTEKSIRSKAFEKLGRHLPSIGKGLGVVGTVIASLPFVIAAFTIQFRTAMNKMPEDLKDVISEVFTDIKNFFDPEESETAKDVEEANKRVAETSEEAAEVLMDVATTSEGVEREMATVAVGAAKLSEGFSDLKIQTLEGKGGILGFIGAIAVASEKLLRLAGIIDGIDFSGNLSPSFAQGTSGGFSEDAQFSGQINRQNQFRTGSGGAVRTSIDGPNGEQMRRDFIERFTSLQRNRREGQELEEV